MLFNSYEFQLVFLPVVFLGFLAACRFSRVLAAAWLTLASIAFYGWWNPKFVALLLVSIGANYAAGMAIERAGPKASKFFLALAIMANLALLGFFKYANFFLETLNSAGASLALPNIVLPLGISFFTFTQIAYLVDVSRKEAHEGSLLHYTLFVTWFPHLIAGPVLHHQEMMPQFADSKTYRLDMRNLSIGLTIFALGLFKKVMIADEFAQYAQPLFSQAGADAPPMLFAAWTAALSYSLQLYFDFSGYSDMAIGLSRMFNIRLPLNFNSPYKASSIIEFWQRWHMTLSRFLRDYLYVPLGGNRKGPARRYVNLMITMLLGGLWHGAGWTFVLWGGLHGIFLIINHAWRALSANVRTGAASMLRPFAVLLTFVTVVFAWVPFRAESVSQAVSVWRGMLGLNGISVPESWQSWWPVRNSIEVNFTGPFPNQFLNGTEITLMLIAGLMIIWFLPNTQQWMSLYAPAAQGSVMQWRPSPRYAIMAGVLLGLCLMSMAGASEFLYFRF